MQRDKIPSKEKILSALPEFVVNINQVLPQFSAIHINGKREYKLAIGGVNFLN